MRRTSHRANAMGAAPDASSRGGGALRPADLDTCAQWAWLTGRLGEAIDLYSDLARVYAKFPNVHFKLGFLFLAVNDPRSAVAHFTAEIDRSATTTGELERPAPQPQDAEEDCRDATAGGVTAQPPQNARVFLLCAHIGRHEAYLALGEHGLAEGDLLYIANRGGRTQTTLIAMGTLFSDLGMLQRAETCFDQCAELDAGDPGYLVAHADLCLAQKRYARAESMYEKCRAASHSSSVTFHRALIGQGTALLRNRKLQDAAVLLLQAMNNLRVSLRDHDRRGSSEILASLETVSPSSSPTYRSSETINLSDLVFLYHQATNLYGGVCLMLGNLKAALDTFASVARYNGQNSALTPFPFHLPMICVLPGTKDARGDVVDSTKLTVANLTELVRHLDEVEWRYGPDPCLYFHRANAHRALGDLHQFVHDLSLVEVMDPDFLKVYLARDSFGDFLDLETIAWIPVRVVESIHTSLERGEYKAPTISGGLLGRSPTNVDPRGRNEPRNKGKPGVVPKPSAVFSESAIFDYFQQRVDHRSGLDEYAQVYQLDAFRRLPLSRTKCARKKGDMLHHLADWEGAHLDVVHSAATTKESDSASRVTWGREMVKAALTTHGQHPFVHMAAGMIELELSNASIAQLYFTEALDKIEKRSSASMSSRGVPRLLSLSRNWEEAVLIRMKYYCLIWRSMASRLRVEMERAVEDLNVAAAIKLSAKISGAEDPLLIAQRSLIMLFNGYLKSAHKLLRQLEKRSELVLKRQVSRHQENKDELADLIAVNVADMLSNAGLKSFHLLPAAVEKEFKRLPSAHALLTRPVNGSAASNVNGDDEQDDSLDDSTGVASSRATKLEEERAVAIVKNTLGKRTMGSNAHGSTVLQTETLDKFFEAGLKKLAHSGRLSEAIPFFLAALLVEENYLPPANFASLELLKCKENEFVEEKLYNCFVQLGKRSRWLSGILKWRFEAMVDVNLAHAYLPSDLDTLWHRARLYQEGNNFTSAINDLSGCLDLLEPHITWRKNTKKRGKSSATFPNETKRTQWLQLLLERGQLETSSARLEEAINDFTVVIDQAGKTNIVFQISALEGRSASLIQLHRYATAIQDLQQQRLLTIKLENDDGASAGHKLHSRETDLLSLVLIGNLYCQLALDQMRLSSAISQKSAPGSNVLIVEQLKTLHHNTGFLRRAAEVYDEAFELAPNHFLTHFCIGRMHAIARQPRLAIKSLTECLRQQPLFLPAIFLRGCVYAQEQLMYLALADFYRVRHRAPAYPNLHTSIGYCHFERSDIVKAVKSLTEALVIEPDDVDALYMRGCALQELFVLGNAEKDFTQALRLYENHPRALYQRSVCATLRQDYAAANTDLEALMRLEPDWGEMWTLHAYTSFCSKRFDAAVFSYSRAIGLFDGLSARGTSFDSSCGTAELSALYMYRAFAQLQSGHMDAALLDLDLAAKRDNSNTIAFFAKAFLLMQASDPEKAALVLSHALQNTKRLALFLPSQLSSPTKPARRTSVAGLPGFYAQDVSNISPSDLQSSLAVAPSRITRDLREKTKASTGAQSSVLFRKRREDRDNQLNNHLGLNSTHHQHRVSQGAISANNHIGNLPAISKSATRAKMIRVIKRMMFEHRVLKALKMAANSKQRKNEQNTRALKEVLEVASLVLWPKGTQTTNTLVWAYNTLGVYRFNNRKVDDALMAFTMAMQADPSSAMTCFNRGNVYLHIDVLHSSVSGFQDAIEMDECYFQAYNNLGVAFYHLDRLEEALEVFSSGLHRADGTKHKAVLLYNLGVICQVQGKSEEAVDLYQRAIQLDGTRVEFFNNRSSILHQQMKFTVALEDYNRALALPTSFNNHAASGVPAESQPSSIEALLNRAQLYISMGSCASAIQDLKVVLRALIHLRTSQGEPTASSIGGNATNSMVPDRSSLRVHFDPNDELLVSNLLLYCEQWQRALEIAVNDFLYGIESFPFIEKLQLSAIANALEEVNQYRDIAPTTEMSNVVVALPISDSSFFNYQVDLVKQIDEFSQLKLNDGASSGIDSISEELEKQPEIITSTDDSINSILFVDPLLDDIKKACKECGLGNYEAACRFLLRAHYKTNIDSHEEYAVMIWRMQIILNSSHDDLVMLSEVIRQLDDFLVERQTSDEAAFTSAYATGKATVKKSRTYSAHFDEDGELRSANDIAWAKQRRVIRADTFVFLGCLLQLNGQPSEARAAFARALHLRNDHVYALLNFLQLCILLQDHENALNSTLKVMEILSSCVHNTDREQKVPGLFNADRSVAAMLSPGLKLLENDEAIGSQANQLMQTMKEYRSLVMTHIESNRSQIFRKQGVLARQAQTIRDMFTAKSTEQLRSQSEDDHRNGDDFSLDLESLDRMVDEYTSRIVAAPGDFSADPSFEAFNSAFEDEFSRVCESILLSLPEGLMPLAVDPTASHVVEQNVVNTEATVNSLDSARSPKSPRGDRRRSTMKRPATTPLKVRRHTQTSAEVYSTSDGQQTKVVVTAVNGTQPQRPHSGPTTAQRRRTTFENINGK